MFHQCLELADQYVLTCYIFSILRLTLFISHFTSPFFRMDSGFLHLASFPLLILFKILYCTLHSLWSKASADICKTNSFYLILLTCFLQKFFKIRSSVFFTVLIVFKAK